MKKIILFIVLLLAPISFTDAWWQPTVAQDLTWQWQLNTGDVDTSYDVDMYDVDLFDTPQSKIDELHADGRIVICYFSAGSWEDWRSDAGDFAESVKGDDLDGWAGEKWLDIRDVSLQPIMQARLDVAVSRSCDGVEPDNIDGYTNTTGFPLTANDQLTYNNWLATEAHSRDLSIGLKNDVDQINDLVGSFDWALNEQCYQYNECDGYQTFITADKPVFGVEYRVDTDKFCAQSNASGYSWLKKNLDLDAYRFGCEDYIIRDDGGTVLNINLTGSLQNPAFSPDGSKILFTRWRNGYNEGPADLYIYDVASENVTELMNDGNDNVNLPGSSWVQGNVVFSSSRDPHDEVFRISDSATTGAEVKITDRVGGSAKMSYEPTFSPDGEWIAFETHDVDVPTDGIITKYKIDGSSSYINLTDVGDDCRQPNWSPQEDKILYQKLDGGVWDIWTMNTDGTNKTKITSSTGDKTDAVFSEEGNYIIYSSDFETDLAQIYKIPVAGGTAERLTNFAGYDGAPSVSPDRSKLAFESNDNAPDGSNGTKLVIKNISLGTADVPIYRLYNKRTGVHLYTKGESDKDKILAKWSDFEFTDNGPTFYASLTDDGTTPIYRLYNTRTGVHLYTRGDIDKNKVLDKWSDFQFTDNGPAFYASLTDDGTTPIYRLYNTRTGVHLYTKGSIERNKILNKWKDFQFTDNSPAFYAKVM